MHIIERGEASAERSASTHVMLPFSGCFTPLDDMHDFGFLSIS